MTECLNKVNCFVIGSAKSGTSWLFECFKEHPDVLVSPTGEIDYYTYHFEKGINWYHHHFNTNKPFKAVLDISPSYFTYNKCPRRIYQYNSGAKIILIIRHPIERAYSHYCMHLRGGQVTRDVDKEIRSGTRYIEDSLYFKHISRYLTYFDRNQIYVLSYDFLVNDPGKYFINICEIIGVDTDYIPSIIDKKYHQKKGIPRNQKLYNSMVRFSSLLTKNPKLSWFTSIIDEFRKSKHVSVVHKIVGSQNDFPSISKDKYSDLMAIFADDLKNLELLLGIDCNHWLSKKLTFID